MGASRSTSRSTSRVQGEEEEEEEKEKSKNPNQRFGKKQLPCFGKPEPKGNKTEEDLSTGYKDRGAEERVNTGQYRGFKTEDLSTGDKDRGAEERVNPGQYRRVEAGG